LVNFVTAALAISGISHFYKCATWCFVSHSSAW